MIAPHSTLASQNLTKGDVKRAGKTLKDLLRSKDIESDEIIGALKTAQIWRSWHLYPINAFQATLRNKLKALGFSDALVAQRLKRLFTIVNKLSRMEGNLDTMQDIGGIRIVFKKSEQLEKFAKNLYQSRFQHRLVREKDYIEKPKDDGYRGRHFVYKYYNAKAPQQLQGLNVEIQLRTKKQHLWATAVEAVDMFYGHSLKFGTDDSSWKDFFLLASCMIAYSENTPLPSFYKNWHIREIVDLFNDKDKDYDYLNKLDAIKLGHKLKKLDAGAGDYHILLFVHENGQPKIGHSQFKNKDDADLFYKGLEDPDIRRSVDFGEIKDVVLVHANANELRKLYSNYFLDVKDFISELEKIRYSI